MTQQLHLEALPLFLLPLKPFSASIALSLCVHLQVLCGQALKQRQGCLRRPLVASLGFSASARHIPQASRANCTTHTPAKASCSGTLPPDVTLTNTGCTDYSSAAALTALLPLFFSCFTSPWRCPTMRSFCLQARVLQLQVCTPTSPRPQPPPPPPPR